MVYRWCYSDSLQQLESSLCRLVMGVLSFILKDKAFFLQGQRELNWFWLFADCQLNRSPLHTPPVPANRSQLGTSNTTFPLPFVPLAITNYTLNVISLLNYSVSCRFQIQILTNSIIPSLWRADNISVKCKWSRVWCGMTLFLKSDIRCCSNYCIKKVLRYCE